MFFRQLNHLYSHLSNNGRLSFPNKIAAELRVVDVVQKYFRSKNWQQMRYSEKKINIDHECLSIEKAQVTGNFNITRVNLKTAKAGGLLFG